MKPSPLESSLLRACERRCKAIALQDPTFIWRKRHGNIFTVAGDPDLYGVWRGTHWEIELKRPGEQPTTLQAFRLHEWSKTGARTFVVHNLEELDNALSKIHE